MGTRAEGEAIAKSAGGAFVSTNRFEGSTATTVAVTDIGCECIKQ